MLTVTPTVDNAYLYFQPPFMIINKLH
jgi:hypothetical protein